MPNQNIFIKTTRINTALKDAVGPAPWYWNTFKPFIDQYKNEYHWKFHGTEGTYAYMVTLALKDKPDHPRLALNNYVRAFNVGHYLGLWYPNDKTIKIDILDPSTLSEFDIIKAVEIKKSITRYYPFGKTISHVEINTNLPKGIHAFQFPNELLNCDEIFLIDGDNPEAPTAPFKVFSVRPKESVIEVFPQEWFKDADFGYQWITRVTRDKKTGRMIGDGVRIDAFELAEDGCNLYKRII